MSSYKETYITAEEFAALQQMGQLYEGFVEYVGYAYITKTYVPPPNQNGYNPMGHVPPDMTHFQLFKVQHVDISPQARAMSLRKKFPHSAGVYVVQAGDTLSAIAQQFGITVNDLMKWNDISDPNRIQAGQALLLSATVQANEGGSYTYIKSALEIAGTTGTLASTLAGLRYTPSSVFGGGYWRGVNGKYYATALAQEGAQGWRIYQNSMNIAKNSSKYLRWGGNTLGGISTVYSAYNFSKYRSWEDGIDTAAGIISYFFWEVGLVYFSYKGMYKSTLYNTKLMMEHGMDPLRRGFTLNKE